MTTLTNNLNEELFTDLAPTQAAAINGGYPDPPYTRSTIEFRQRIKGFDFRLPLNGGDSFSVGSGRDIKLSSFTTSNSKNKKFTAVLINSGGQRYRRQVSVGNDTNLWNNVRGGNYRLELLDENDRYIVKGRVVVASGNF